MTSTPTETGIGDQHDHQLIQPLRLVLPTSPTARRHPLNPRTPLPLATDKDVGAVITLATPEEIRARAALLCELATALEEYAAAAEESETQPGDALGTASWREQRGAHAEAWGRKVLALAPIALGKTLVVTTHIELNHPTLAEGAKA